MYRSTGLRIPPTWSRCIALINAIIPAMVAVSFTASVSHAQATRDFSKIEVQTLRITDNFHVLDFGGTGAAIGVLSGPDGVLMIDDQFAPLAPKIEAAIKAISPQPIRYVINTHAHSDHADGNAYFSKLGATIVAREQVRARMMRTRPGANGQPTPPVDAATLPTQVYDQQMTLHFSGEEVRLIAVPNAHTDGDTLVYLPHLDILLVGDLFRPTPYPHIDLAGGGSLSGTLAGLQTMIDLSGPNTKIVAGHGGPLSDRATMIKQRDLIITVRDRVAALVAQGKSEADVLAAKVTAGLDSRVPPDDITVDRFVREVYADLTRKR